MRHELKTDAPVFQAVCDGAKSYEIRRDDRGFAEGDVLLLRETASTGEEMRGGAPLVYTGREEERTVGHVLRGPIYGLAEGWVILSFAPPPPDVIRRGHEALEQLEALDPRVLAPKRYADVRAAMHPLPKEE